MKITISDIRQRNIANGGHFFDRATMRSQGQTMKNFKLVIRDGQHFIHHKNSRREWPVNPTTGRTIISRNNS